MICINILMVVLNFSTVYAICMHVSVYVSGPLLWNSLPLTVRDMSLTLTQFCTRLKTFYVFQNLRDIIAPL